MVAPINRISGGVSPTSPLGRSEVGVPFHDFNISFEENFPFPEKELLVQNDKSSGDQTIPSERPNYRILHVLLQEIMESDILILPTPMQDKGSHVVEAYFKPPIRQGEWPTIHLPLPQAFTANKPILSKTQIKTPVSFQKSLDPILETIFQAFSDEKILRLIIVGSHEFGHYKSYCQGNFDTDLKRGLYMFHVNMAGTNNADKFTWLVFQEECNAWKHAESFLGRHKFEFLQAFNQVKDLGLQAYFDVLKLKKASIDTFYKLSLIGEDFTRNSRSDFFEKYGATKTLPTSTTSA